MFDALVVFAALNVWCTRCGAFLRAVLCVPLGEPACGVIRDRTIAAIGDPRALAKLLVHAIRQGTSLSSASFLRSDLDLGLHLRSHEAIGFPRGIG
jgi:hypothetical protein